MVLTPLFSNKQKKNNISVFSQNPLHQFRVNGLISIGKFNKVFVKEVCLLAGLKFTARRLEPTKSVEEKPA